MPSPSVAVQRHPDLRPTTEQVSLLQPIQVLGELDQLIKAFKWKMWELAAHVVPTSVDAEADLRASTFESASWVALATSLFPNTREMTQEERDEFAEIHRQSFTTLGKPIKKVRPR